MSDDRAPMGPGAALRARREAILGVHLRGETEMDSDLVLSTMTGPPTYELPSADVVLRGRDHVTVHHADQSVVVEVETDPNGLDGSTPGQVATVKTIGVFPFDGERSLGEKVYGDMSPLLPHLTFLGAPADAVG